MDKAIFWAILIIFPLGQITKFGYFNLIDLLVFVLSILTLFKHKNNKYPVWFWSFLSFSLFGIFSWVVNFSNFNSYLSIKGLLYSLRIISYSLIAVFVFNNYKSQKDKFKLKRNLIYLGLASLLVGFIQYYFIPDLRFLKLYGWDDHLFRMAGLFFDPTFLALIFVFTIILSLKNSFYLYLLTFGLALTYSRVGYMVAILTFFLKRKYFEILLLLVFVTFVPKMVSEGTNFLRTTSGVNKLSDYHQTLDIIKESPVLGVGFNNLCPIKLKLNKSVDISSHSCFGSDSSILFILATTGVVGLMLFVKFISMLPRSSTLLLTGLVLFIHSLFANSLFYPHIMFWLFSLLALETEVDS